MEAERNYNPPAHKRKGRKNGWMFYVPKKNNNIVLEWHLLSTLAVLEQVYLIVIIFRLFIPVYQQLVQTIQTYN